MLIETERYRVRLAKNQEDILAAQRLRYRVFVTEMGAKAKDEDDALGIEADCFDPFCDHLLLEEKKTSHIVGVYRLLRGSKAKEIGRFYSEDEFNLDRIVSQKLEIMELGRTCVDPNHRGGAVLQLLWMGLGRYIIQHDIGLMFGCASFHGKDPQEHALALSYLYHYHLSPELMRTYAKGEHISKLNLLPIEAIDPKQALRVLPPLIKGYLRLGGYVGDGAFIDQEFNTIDVCILIATDRIPERQAQFFVNKVKDSSLV